MIQNLEVYLLVAPYSNPLPRTLQVSLLDLLDNEAFEVGKLILLPELDAEPSLFLVPPSKLAAW